MKNLIICVLTVLCVASTDAGFSQTKQETLPEKLLRLQTENEVLKRENLSLKKQVADLQKVTQNLPSKPYYLNKQVEQLCDKYPLCRKEAEGRYREDHYFQIVSLKKTEEVALSLFGYPKHHTQTMLQGNCRQHYRRFECQFSLVVAYDGKPLK